MDILTQLITVTDIQTSGLNSVGLARTAVVREKSKTQHNRYRMSKSARNRNGNVSFFKATTQPKIFIGNGKYVTCMYNQFII